MTDYIINFIFEDGSRSILVKEKNGELTIHKNAIGFIANVLRYNVSKLIRIEIDKCISYNCEPYKTVKVIG